MTRVLGQLRKNRTLPQALKLARSVPTLMSEAPFANLIWDADRDRMATRNATLAVNLLLYMLGAKDADARLRQSYAVFRGTTAGNVRLPNKLVK